MNANASELSALKETLTSIHDRMDVILINYDTASLQRTLVTDQWNVLDEIGHINGWGLLFLDEARYMAQFPGRPFPYRIFTKSNFDDENEALVARRRGWTLEQHRAENQQLSQGLSDLIDSLGGAAPDRPVPLPWDARPMNIEELLRYHHRHGDDHLREILMRLE